MNLFLPSQVLADLLLKSLLVFCPTILLLILFQRASAAGRHAIYLSLFGALFLLPLTSILPIRWNLPSWDVPIANAPADRARSEVALPGFEKIHALASGQWHGAESVAPTKEPHLKRAWMPTVGQVAFWLWASGVGLLMIRRALGEARLRALLRSSQRVEHPALSAKLEALTQCGGGRIEVRQSSKCVVPIVAGTRRPVILLPRGAEAWEPSFLHSAVMHEMAHVERKDCLSRLLVDLVCAFYWPNPMVWVAAKRLRFAQEEACDDRVLSHGVKPECYAAQLLEVARGLSHNPLVGALAMAQSSMLERRVLAIMDGNRERGAHSTRARIVSCVGMFIVLLMASSNGSGANAAPSKNNLTTTSATQNSQPEKALKASAGEGWIVGKVIAAGTEAPIADAEIFAISPAMDMREFNPNEFGDYVHGRSDARGEFTLAVRTDMDGKRFSLDVRAPNYGSTAGTLMSGGDEVELVVKSGERQQVEVRLKDALYVAGKIIDEDGKPVLDASIEGRAVSPGRYGYVRTVDSRAQGAFEIFDFAPLSKHKAGRGELRISSPRHQRVIVEDVYALNPQERKSLVIQLRRGRQLDGTVLNSRGEPITGASIRTDGTSDDRETRSDDQGCFSLGGLEPGAKCKLIVQALKQGERKVIPLTLDRDRVKMRVRTEPIGALVGLKPIKVLGMQLVDLTPALVKAYDLPDSATGAMIVNPGVDSHRLRIGNLETGMFFWNVGGEETGAGAADVKGVHSLVKNLLALAKRLPGEGAVCRIVYGSPRWTNTQHIVLTQSDLRELEALLNVFP